MSRAARRVAILALLVGVAFTAAAAAAQPPNIVFIISDDHRWDGLGAAGNPNVQTPHLDRLAKDGVHFLQATMHVAQCSPGRAQLLTGLPPHTTGWYSNQHRSPAVDRTDGFARFKLLPALLQKAGYQTVFTGKWHLTPEPWDSGFADVLTWLPGGGGPYRNLPVAYGRSRDLKPAEGYTQERFTDDAIGFLKSDAAGRKPFFLWVALTAPHAPFGPNPPHIEQLYAGKTAAQLMPPGFKGETAATSWNKYYESISFLDEQVGRVLQTLEERRLEQNTIVVFLGDNGFMMGDRGWNGKVLPYEGSVRVPLIVRAPRLVKVTGRTDAAASSLDLPPTFLRWAGLKPPAEWPGRDLTPALQRRSHGLTYAISEFADNHSAQFGQYAYRMVRTPTHKLILWERAEKKDELYELAEDPRETHNVAGNPAVSRVERDLRATLAAWMKQTGDTFRKREATPNIVLLIVDDVRWDALGAAGNRFVKTPRIDRLAKEGVRFAQARVTTSICMVSRATLLTGQYMSRHGITTFGRQIAPDAFASALPAVLRRAGYWTGYVGKYGIGRPRDEDFDFLRAYEGTHWITGSTGERIHVTEKNARDSIDSCGPVPRTSPFRSRSVFSPHMHRTTPPSSTFPKTGARSSIKE